MFGVGGGFLMTPLLVFLGTGPGVAVASSANYIAASSFSGALSYWRRRLVDVNLSAALLARGLLETFSSIWLFQKLRALGQLDQVIRISYLLLLTLVGGTSSVLTMATIIVATILHAATSHLIDGVLALIVMIGGVVGARFGVCTAQLASAECLRLLLGLLVLAVGIRFAVEMLARLGDLFSIRPAGDPL
jgi:uncharacterized membrane protein YfcA